MAQITCCKDCKDRYQYCHDTCEKYLAEKDEMIQEKIFIGKEKNKVRQFDNFKVSQVIKTNKRLGKR